MCSISFTAFASVSKQTYNISVLAAQGVQQTSTMFFPLPQNSWKKLRMKHLYLSISQIEIDLVHRALSNIETIVFTVYFGAF